MAFRRESIKAAVLAAVLLVLLPAAAHATPQWLGAGTLDAGGTGVGSPDVTADAQGNAAAVWVTPAGRVQVAERPFGGPWGGAHTLETEDPATSGSILNAPPRIVAEPSGALVAVWLADAGGVSGNHVRWARRPPGGAWSAPGIVAQAASGVGLSDVVAGERGDITALWTDDGVPHTSTKAAGGTTWASETLPASGRGLVLAMAGDGSAGVAYAAGGCADVDCVFFLRRPAGGPWERTPELVGVAGGNVAGIGLATRGAGYTAIWGEGAPLSRGPRLQVPDGHVRFADRAGGDAGAWAPQGSVADLKGGAPGCVGRAVGCMELASRGDTLAAVWQQGDGDVRNEIAASLRSGSGAWTGPEAVGDVASGDAFPQAAIAADGTALAAWGSGQFSFAVARGSHRSRDGHWTPEDLGAPVEGPAVELQDLVADGAGDAVTGWTDGDGALAAGFDAAGPRFTAFSLPSGRQNDLLRFSAAAADNWSGPAAIAWRFGDGGAAQGAQAGHVYGAAGNYTATATATDAIGNASAGSGTVPVAGPDPAPGPTPDPCGTTDADRDGVKDLCDTNNGALAPVPFKTVNASVVSGEVFIKLPAGAASAAQGAKAPKGFVRLAGAQTIPVGSTLDTAKGVVRLRSAADTRKHVQSGKFSRGRFVVRQVRRPRGRARRRSTKLITDLKLTGSSFRRACRAPTASTSARRRSRKRVRRLFGDAKGSFRTRGRNAAATVRGTRWGVQDRCDGTLVTVRRGRVSVRDLVRHRTVLVRAGHTYLARRR